MLETITKVTEKRSRNLRKIMEIIKSGEYDTDYKLALELRRIYPSYSEFRRAYFIKKPNKKNTGMFYKLRPEFARHKNAILEIGRLYREFDKSGALKHLQEEEKFLIKIDRNIDSREVIGKYITSNCSYDLPAFYEEAGISKKTFDCCVKRIEHHDEELYAAYLEKVEQNKVARLAMPLYQIEQIVNGIKEGKTFDGNDFNLYEFYKLVPFKGKDIDREVLAIYNSDPERFANLLKYKALKQMCSAQRSYRPWSYVDNIYLFTRLFNVEHANILRQYMEDNNIKGITPIYRAATVNCYINSSDPSFTMDDANEIFDTMEEKGYPKIKEVYDLLKQEKLNKKNNKGFKLEYTKKDN